MRHGLTTIRRESILLRRGLSTVRREYEQRVSKQVLKSSESQLRVVDMMDDIRSRIEAWNAPSSLNEFERVIEPLVKPVRKEDEEDEAEEKVEEKVSVKKQKEFEPPPPSPRGLYIYGTWCYPLLTIKAREYSTLEHQRSNTGTVGCGKSMIMDLFFSSVQVSDQENDGKIRLHFETFMSEVHRT